MKTKIKAIQANGTYKSNYGLLYKFEYEFEDGEVINANHKTENSPFDVGDEVEYEITKKFDWGKIGKVQKPQEEYKDKNTKGIEVGHAINNAVNLMAAGVELEVKQCNSNEEKIYLYAKQIMAISERLKNE